MDEEVWPCNPLIRTNKFITNFDRVNANERERFFEVTRYLNRFSNRSSRRLLNVLLLKKIYRLEKKENAKTRRSLLGF